MLLGGEDQRRALIVLGDLNDEPLAATTQILLGPPGSEIDTAGFQRADLGDGQRLWNLAPRILPEDRRLSRVFSGRPELIDHVLGSRALVHRTNSVTTETADLPSVTVDLPNGAMRRSRTCSGDGGELGPRGTVIARFDLGRRRGKRLPLVAPADAHSSLSTIPIVHGGSTAPLGVPLSSWSSSLDLRSGRP